MAVFFDFGHIVAHSFGVCFENVFEFGVMRQLRKDVGHSGFTSYVVMLLAGRNETQAFFGVPLTDKFVVAFVE